MGVRSTTFRISIVQNMLDSTERSKQEVTFKIFVALMAKYSFSAAETFAVWRNNYERCWLCHRPLSLTECTVDHVLPERLIENDEERAAVFRLFGLDSSFELNSFENWLPAHNWCNGKKSDVVLDYSGGVQIVLQKLREHAHRTATMAANLQSQTTKGRVLGPLGAALSSGSLTEFELGSFLSRYGYSLGRAELPDEIILLSGGKWYLVKDIRREGFCQCERYACVESDRKVYCYFGTDLSDWVVGTGLYYKCYDEVVVCHRCGQKHKRGHIGKTGYCDCPYASQSLQTD